MTDNDQTQGELYLGLDIGGTKCSVVVGDASFSIKRKIVFDTHTERGYQAILSEFQKYIKLIPADSIGDYAALCVAIYEDKF